ncbi:hypothetical protein F4808DRAFT_474981 [Astrocystis sublimbata]|nr:hypothetical protein F4808DRAFT_474981 [Astrocystis sublimbata]
MPAPSEEVAAPIATGATAFSHFASLPLELRLMIWEEFVRTPRVIYFIIDSAPSQPSPGYQPSPGFQPDPRFTIRVNGTKYEQACPLLRVNRESRHTAMKNTLFFSIGIRDYNHRTGRFSDIRHFVFRRCDAVYFDYRDLEAIGAQTAKMRYGDTDKITNIIIGARPEVVMATNTMGFIVDLLHILQLLKNIQSLESIRFLILRHSQHPSFELDDLLELSPKDCPKHRWYLERWQVSLRSLHEFFTEVRLARNLKDDVGIASMHTLWTNPKGTECFREGVRDLGYGDEGA